MAELAIAGKTAYNIAAFNFERPAIVDPTYKPQFFMTTEATTSNSKL